MPSDPTLIESGDSGPHDRRADAAVEKTLIESRSERGADDRTLLEGQPPPTPGGGVGLNLVPSAQFLEYRLVEPIKVASGEAELWVADGGGRRVVLKFYRWGLHPKAGLTEKLSRISKAQIVEVYARGTSPDGRDYEILEFIKHGTLADFGKDELPETKVRDVLRELTDAVAALHAENILHRDLKPANVLVRTLDPLDLVLTDFGISSVMDVSLHVTSVSRTAAYSAPEAMTGVVSKASDWWSVGVMVMELLQGSQPFAGLDERAINFALVMRGIPVSKEVPIEWQVLLKGLLTRDHAKRWNELQIRQWLEGKRNIPVYYDDTTANPAVRIKQKHRPCQFLKTEHFEPGELAVAMAEQWDEAAKRFERGLVADWIKKEVQNADLASLLMDIREDVNLTADQKLSVALLAMNDQLPLSWRGEVVNREWMATQPGIAVEFLKSDLSAWLKRLRKETWLEVVKDRYLELLRKMNGTCNEETILKAALATDEALMQAGKTVQEQCISSSDPQLEILLHKKKLLPMQAAVLALAPPTFFAQRSEAVENRLTTFTEKLQAIARLPLPTTRPAMDRACEQIRQESEIVKIDLFAILNKKPARDLTNRIEAKTQAKRDFFSQLLAEWNEAKRMVQHTLPQQLGAGQLRSVNQQLQQIKAQFADIDCSEIDKAIDEWKAFYLSPRADIGRFERDLLKLLNEIERNLDSSEINSLEEQFSLLRTDIAQRQQTLNEKYQGTEFNEVAVREIASLSAQLTRLEVELQRIKQRYQAKDRRQAGAFLIFLGIGCYAVALCVIVQKMDALSNPYQSFASAFASAFLVPCIFLLTATSLVGGGWFLMGSAKRNKNVTQERRAQPNIEAPNERVGKDHAGKIGGKAIKDLVVVVLTGALVFIRALSTISHLHFHDVILIAAVMCVVAGFLLLFRAWQARKRGKAE